MCKCPLLFQREQVHVPETVFSGLMLAVSLFFWREGDKAYCSVSSSGLKLGQWMRDVWGCAGGSRKGSWFIVP